MALIDHLAKLYELQKVDEEIEKSARRVSMLQGEINRERGTGLLRLEQLSAQNRAKKADEALRDSERKRRVLIDRQRTIGTQGPDSNANRRERRQALRDAKMVDHLVPRYTALVQRDAAELRSATRAESEATAKLEAALQALVDDQRDLPA